MNTARKLIDFGDHAAATTCPECGNYELSLCRALSEAGLTTAFPGQTEHTVSARRIVCRGRDLADVVPVICNGWAASTITLSNGGRQILTFLLPGDLVSTSLLFDAPSQLVVEAITDVRYRLYNRGDLKAAILKNPGVFGTFSKILTEEKSRMDQLVIGLGRRSADERIAQLILSLRDRLDKRGLVRGATFDFPLRQHHIADAMGLTPVHVSKILSEFRRGRIITLSERSLTILDPGRLEQIASLR